MDVLETSKDSPTLGKAHQKYQGSPAKSTPKEASLVSRFDYFATKYNWETAPVAEAPVDLVIEKPYKGSYEKEQDRDYGRKIKKHKKKKRR